ncbi:3-hydroxyacid dehydrogenase/reductase [Akanthomyces lecanii RCEF 1005]|uniref:3-hydroxyacid dehydrogenase/reductase n=1 Tax=Akanthomyces lecanii RCEF 1005 TaxID=1081108 RepID=A0A168L1D7_CORDF|nr:3-hydroxyacid dehydrogenase/reductase [Akanthomyces lecanii RCEF 1005]
MATNLQKHLSKTSSPSLVYHNRTMSRGDALQDLGANPSASVADLASNADIIFLSLSDDSALDSVISSLSGPGCAADMSGKIVVDTSTVHPDTTAAAHQRLTNVGAKFVAAPVFGASPVAAEGQLLFILAGPGDAVQALEPFLVGVMARSAIRLGEDVTKSSLLKTAGNFVTAGMMEVVAEAHVFAEKTGLGNEAMEALLEQQYGPLAYSMSRRLTTGAYMPPPGERPWSDLNLAIKDVGHGISAASATGVRLHVGEVAIKHLNEARTRDRPLDSSSMYGVLREEAGLDFATDLVKNRDNVQ